MAVVSVCLSVGAQFTLKSGMAEPAVQSALRKPFEWQTAWLIATRPGIVGGLLLYFLSAAVWLGVLARWDVSKAYPLVGAGFLLTAAIGAFAGEHLSMPRVVGIVLIAAGVALVART